MGYIQSIFYCTVNNAIMSIVFIQKRFPGLLSKLFVAEDQLIPSMFMQAMVQWC